MRTDFKKAFHSNFSSLFLSFSPLSSIISFQVRIFTLSHLEQDQLVLMDCTSRLLGGQNRGLGGFNHMFLLIKTAPAYIRLK